MRKVRDEAMQEDFWSVEVDKNNNTKIKINPLHFKNILRKQRI